MAKASHRKRATHRKAAHAHRAVKTHHTRRTGVKSPSTGGVPMADMPEADVSGDEIRSRADESKTPGEEEVGMTDEASTQAQARVREDDSEDELGSAGPSRGETY